MIETNFRPESAPFLSYVHWIEGKAMFAGFCRFDELFAPPDAYDNPLWLQHVRNAPSVMITNSDRVSILAEAAKKTFQIVQTLKPFCNVPQRLVKIKCVETGEIFDTQKQACERYNIAVPNMHVYMRENAYRIGKKLKGFTFEKT